MAYDAFLLLSFGGPEHPDDVMPFLRERDPRPRRAAGAARRGGRALPALRRRVADQRAVPGPARRDPADFAAHGVDLPIYWGNRNWHPMLADTAGADARRRRAARARRSSPARTAATRRAGSTWRTSPRPGRRSATARPRSTSCATSTTTRASSSRTPTRCAPRWPRSTRPAGRAPGWSSPRTRSRCRWPPPPGPDGGRYEAQLQRDRRAGRAPRPRPTCRGTWSGRAAPARRRCRGWSRTSTTTWRRWPTTGVTGVVVSPIGFVSDHLEVVWDLDNEAARHRRAARPRLRPGRHARHRSRGSSTMVARAGRGAARRGAPRRERRLGTLPGLGRLPGCDCCPTPRRTRR